MMYSYKNFSPKLDDSVFVADYATITGDVEIDAQTTIWFNTVIRGDVAPVRIGKGVSIQDLCCIHQSPNNPVIIEDYVTIGHQATLHSCLIQKEALIGMGAIILDGAVIGEGAMIGAGSVVTPGTKIPPHMLALGTPAKVVRPVSEAEKADRKRIIQEYIEKGQVYRQMQKTPHKC